MNITQTLARYIAEARYEDLPKEVVETSKRLILDTVGVSLAALGEDVGRIILDFVEELGGHPQARVPGSGLATSSVNAAFAGGALAHALDFDDSWYWPTGHPSCTTVPVLLALGEKFRLSGKRAILAHVLGLEAHGKIGAAAKDSAPGKTGWHGVGSFGTIGAVAAASSLYALNIQQTRMALGIGASQAAGLACNIATMTKPFHAANSARGGIIAAALAGRGYTANPDAIEAQGGFAETFIRPGNFELEHMAADLGVTYHMIDPGVLIKRFPACYSNQWVLQEALELVRQNGIRHEAVEAIVLGAPCEGVVLDIPAPTTGFMAKFSWQFSIAAAIVDGRVGIDSYRDEKIVDPAIKDLMRRIEIIPNPGKPRDNIFPLTIKMKDGRSFEQTVLYPKGHVRNPFTDEEVAEKYRECASLALPADQVERSLECILNLERLDDLSGLMDFLVPGRAGGPSSRNREPQ
jgi:2-methylcitrate dehydratase PrpD